MVILVVYEGLERRKRSATGISDKGMRWSGTKSSGEGFAPWRLKSSERLTHLAVRVVPADDRVPNSGYLELSRWSWPKDNQGLGLPDDVQDRLPCRTSRTMNGGASWDDVLRFWITDGPLDSGQKRSLGSRINMENRVGLWDNERIFWMKHQRESFKEEETTYGEFRFTTSPACSYARRATHNSWAPQKRIGAEHHV